MVGVLLALALATIATCVFAVEVWRLIWAHYFRLPRRLVIRRPGFLFTVPGDAVESRAVRYRLVAVLAFNQSLVLVPFACALFVAPEWLAFSFALALYVLFKGWPVCLVPSAQASVLQHWPSANPPNFATRTRIRLLSSLAIRLYGSQLVPAIKTGWNLRRVAVIEAAYREIEDRSRRPNQTLCYLNSPEVETGAKRVFFKVDQTDPRNVMTFLLNHPAHRKDLSALLEAARNYRKWKTESRAVRLRVRSQRVVHMRRAGEYLPEDVQIVDETPYGLALRVRCGSLAVGDLVQLDSGTHSVSAVVVNLRELTGRDCVGVRVENPLPSTFLRFGSYKLWERELPEMTGS